MSRKCFKVHAKRSYTTVENKQESIFPNFDKQIFVHDGESWKLNNIYSFIQECIVKFSESRGPPGIQGLRGPPGIQGPEGVIGPRGSKGLSGLPGDMGHTGLRGDMGHTGLRGYMGHTGDMGLQGLQGHIGAMGLHGDIGPTGSVYLGDDIMQSIMVGLNMNNPNVGKSSVYVGYDSGKDNSNENVYVGYKVGTVNSGGLNTFIGSEAGRYSSGTQNTYIGDSVCASTGSNGSYNVYVGAEAGFNNTDGFGNVFVGAVSGASNKNGSWNIFVGQSAGNSNISGTNNIFMGANAGISSLYGNSCICIGDGSDTSNDMPINQLVFGQGVVSFGDNTVTFPSNLRALPNGTEVNFSSSGGGCLYPVSSSIRWKNNIEDISSHIDTSRVYDLRPVTFNPAIGHGDERELHIGLIAEEVERIFPVIVPKDDIGRPSSVRYSMLSVLLLAEMKKLRDELGELKTKMLINK